MNRAKINILIIFLASIAVVLPLIFYGLPEGADSMHHAQLAETYYQSIKTGDFTPSWSETENLGYGSVAVRLYPPFFYQSLAVLRIISGNWFAAYWLAFAIWFFVGGLGVYFWTRGIFGEREALFAALIYTFLAPHVSTVYHSSMYPEFAAFSILAFCFAFVQRICANGDIKNVLGLAVSFALLILTHAPAALIGSLALLFYAVFLLIESRNFKVFFRLAASVMTGLFLSSFYWLKVIAENGFLAKDKIYPEQAYDFHINFLLTPFDAEIIDLYFPNALLLAVFVLVVPLVIAYFYQTKKQNITPRIYAVLFTFLFAVLMTTRLSQPIWEYLPLLKETQFPWRWLGIVSLFGAVLAGAAIPKLKDFITQKKRPVALILTGMIFISLAFTGGQVIRTAMFIENFDEWREAQISQQGVQWWWTTWTRSPIFGENPAISIPNRNAQIDEWTAEKREITVQSGEPSKLRVSTFYYPYWKAQINDKNAEVFADENGAILLEIPAEESKVKIEFEEPFYIKNAVWLSLLGWFFIALMMSFLIFKKSEWKN